MIRQFSISKFSFLFRTPWVHPTLNVTYHFLDIVCGGPSSLADECYVSNYTIKCGIKSQLQELKVMKNTEIGEGQHFCGFPYKHS